MFADIERASGCCTIQLQISLEEAITRGSSLNEFEIRTEAASTTFRWLKEWLTSLSPYYIDWSTKRLSLIPLLTRDNKAF